MAAAFHLKLAGGLSLTLLNPSRFVQVDGQIHVVHREEEAQGTRLTIDSLTCLLANETDPSRLRAISPGKLVRYLVADGSQIKRDQPYVEIEVSTIPSLPIWNLTATIYVKLY